MKQLFYLLFSIVLLLQTVIYCQTPGKPFLMAELQDNGVEVDISEYLYRINIRAVDNFNKSPNGIIAVRVCSSDPLPIAMFFGVDNPLNNVPIFSKEYFEPSKNSFQREKKTEIYFLRTDKNCKSYKRGFPTQWWFVPENTDFPEFVEYKKLDDISREYLITENSPSMNNGKFFFEINGNLLETKKDIQVTAENYALAKKKIVELLKKNRTAYLLIGTPHLMEEKKIINPKAIALKTFLNQQGIGNHRIIVRECSRCFYEVYRSESKDLYPSVCVIYQK